MNRRYALVCVAILGILTLGVVAAQPPRYTVDADHGLTTSGAITEYEQTGNVSAEVTTPHLTLTVADRAGACGVDSSLFSDARNTFVCIEYHNDATQTTRVWIPDDYFHPILQEQMEPVGDGPTASLQPVESGNESYTSVTATFDSSGTAVYAIPEDQAAAYSLIERINERTVSVAGFELFTRGTEWQYVNRSSFDRAPSAQLKTEPGKTVVEYDASGPNESAEWLPVPESQGASAPVYTMVPGGTNKTLYVIAENPADAPAIRYRVSGTGLARLDEMLRRLGQIDDWAAKQVENLVPDWVPGV